MYNLVINGCSFTKYLWPTWADFLCTGFEDRVNIGNWAMGPEYVLYTTYPYLKTSDSNTKFIINWPFYSKFDNKKNGKWNTLGNVANAEFKSKKIRKHYYYFYDDDYWFEKLSINMQLLTDLFKNKNIDYYYTSAVDFSKDIRGSDLTTIYQQDNFLIKNFYQIGMSDEGAHVWSKGRFGIKNQVDWHPCCTKQLEIARKISSITNIKLANFNWDKIANDIDNRIREHCNLLTFKPILLEHYIHG